MMKAKLYKGPLNGKSINTDGRNEIVVRLPKPMSRRQRYEFEMNWFNNNGPAWSSQIRYPMIEARYRMIIHPHTGGSTQHGYHMAMLPMMHPDGSYFYEYVEGSKKEF